MIWTSNSRSGKYIDYSIGDLVIYRTPHMICIVKMLGNEALANETVCTCEVVYPSIGNL